jgi:hypothetical protein
MGASLRRQCSEACGLKSTSSLTVWAVDIETARYRHCHSSRAPRHRHRVLLLLRLGRLALPPLPHQPAFSETSPLFARRHHSDPRLTHWCHRPMISFHRSRSGTVRHWVLVVYHCPLACTRLRLCCRPPSAASQIGDCLCRTAPCWPVWRPPRVSL